MLFFLQREMRTAIKSFENMKLDKEYQLDMRESNAILEFEVQSLKSENIQLRSTLEENIHDELSLLQAAIQEAEHQMRALMENNYSLKQQLKIKERLSEDLGVANETLISRIHVSEDETILLRKLEIENQSLITKIQISEEEITFLRKRLDVMENDVRSVSHRERESRIKELESGLKKALEEKEIALNQSLNHYFKNIDTTNKDEQQDELITNLLRENNNYVEIIQHKNKTIDELREDLNNLASAVEHRVTEESESAQNKQKKDQTTDIEITEELANIRINMAVSHNELIDKIVGLHKELKNLKNENLKLQKQVSKKTPVDKSNELKEQIVHLKDENVLLRDALNTPYPGLVDNMLSHGVEVKRLHEENELLRLAVSNDRKELVDSNLRKRKRIKELESEVQSTQQFSPSSSFNTRRHSLSQGEAPESLRHQFPSSFIEDKEKSSPRKCSKKHSPSTGGEDTLGRKRDEMVNQNEIIRKLQKENDSKVNKKDYEKLKAERDQLKRSAKSSEALEKELNSLRNAFKHLNEGSAMAANEQTKQFEKEMKILKKKTGCKTCGDKEDGITPASSPVKTKQSLELELDPNLNHDIFSENLKLKRDLERSNNDVGRLAKILEREKMNKSSADKMNDEKVSKLEERLSMLAEENAAYRNNVKELERENSDINAELNHIQNELSSTEVVQQHTADEVKKLRNIIKDLNRSKEEDRDEENGLNIMIKALTENVDDLQIQRNDLEKKLKRADNKLLRLKKDNIAAQETDDNKIQLLEKDKQRLEQDLLNVKIELNNTQEERNELQRTINKLNDERNEIHETNKELNEELENITNDITESRVAEWLQKDADRRLALLSPESHQNDADSERRTKRDHFRLIRKLQVENQTLRGKLSNLADEAVDTSKLIADLERGHGHLTGVLRCHLILQKPATGKLLEGSLQQYTGDYDSLKRKLSTLEMKYDKEKKFSKRRDHAWDLFTNASATINNIHTILHEGLIKVEEDLEHDLTGDDFENKDYKSRLWILRRRLSDVENRHRELQLKTEELNIRLDAKTTEFEVTQDELEDTTRDLESRESSIQTLRNELKKLTRDNAKLNDLIKDLEEKQKITVGAVMSENEALRNTADDIINVETSLNETIEKLDETEATLKITKTMKDSADKEIDGLNNKIRYLEKHLKEVTEQRDKLRKEAEHRAAYMPNLQDDHGTIHMLRDDIKKLARENADLKKNIVLQQRQMYDMSKDLHKLRMTDTGTSSKQDEAGKI